MAKDPSSQDLRVLGPIEYAYSLMARAAGIDVSETHLFRTRKRSYFGTERFDRVGDLRVHVHSLSGIIHADHRNPTLDYDMLLRVTMALVRNVLEVERAYALACFNVLAHNRDDHAKNFAFLLAGENQWRFAPAYDLTFSNGPGGEQTMMVKGEGKSPGPEQLLALAKAHGLKRGSRILENVRESVSRWRDFAAEAGVSAKSTSDIEKIINPLTPKAPPRKASSPDRRPRREPRRS